MEISGEGTTHSFYPSPASRFGARDRSSRHVGDDIVELKVSPYFRGGVRCGDDWDARSAGDADMTCSPYFDRFDRRSRANGIRDPLPRRGSIDNRLAEIPFGDRLDYENDFREAESFPSEVVSFYRRKHSKTTGEIHAEMELESLASEGRTIRDLKRTEGRKWATEAIAAFPDGGAPLSRSSFDTIFGCSLSDLELFEDSRSIRVSPTRAGTVRDRLRGSRRKQFPGCSEEVRSDAGVGDCGMGTTAGGQIGGGNLSKLFDFAFTNKERREVQEQPNRRSRRSRNDKTLITEQFESFPSADPTAGASEAEHDARSLSSSPRLPVTLKGSPVSASTVQSLVGVTVRRPPSPKFSFMRENVSAEWPSPSRFPPSPRPEKQEDKYCDWETRGEAHNSVEGESFNARDSPSNGRIDVASHGRDDRSVLQTGDASISTPPCRTKRRRPDWSDTSVEKGASADVVSAYSKLSPVSLPVSKRLPAKTPQHHRIKASQEGTEIRDRRHSIGNDDDICVADGWVDWTRSGRRRRHGWWGLGAVTAPVGEVRSRGDAAVDEASVENGSNTSNTKDESRDLEGSRAGDLPTSDDIDHGQELRVEKKKIQTKELSGTELNTGGLLMNDGEQPMAKHRDGSGAEGMTHEDLTIENIASDNGGARTSPRSLDPVRTVDAALAYDRDVLGGDGLEDDTVDMFGLGEGDLLDTLGLPKPVDRCGLPLYDGVVIIYHHDAPEQLERLMQVLSDPDT